MSLPLRHQLGWEVRNVCPFVSQVALIGLCIVASSHARAGSTTYGTYYDETTSANCGPSTQCRLDFSQLPSDKLLRVQKVHCASVAQQPLAQATLEIAATFGGAALTARYLPLGLPSAQLINTQYWTNWDTDTSFLIGNGRFPFILLFTPQSANWQAKCTIIGDLVTPIQ